jgi:hypothetical protein
MAIHITGTDVAAADRGDVSLTGLVLCRESDR